MNIISKAMDHIKQTIPTEVLQVALRDDLHNWRKAPASLDTLIMEKVIKPRVMVDANLVGGTQAIIALDGLTPVRPDNFSVIYEVPLDRTSNREIMSVLSVGYLPFAMSFGFGGISQPIAAPSSMNDLGATAQRVMDSASSIPMVSSAQVDLIGYNTVLIRDQQRMTATYTLRCMMSNDEKLNNIHPRSYLAFAELCELAVKAYIYNKLIIKIDQAFLSGGQELGAMKNYIEGLSDSQAMYRTHLREVWQATAYMNDRTSHERFIRLQISPGL